MLKPEVSISVALATGALVYGVYGIALPDVATSRTSEVNDDDLRAAENVAAWASAAAVGGISLLSKDPVPFIVGGCMIVALSWAHRHARLVDPRTGRLDLSAAKRYLDDETPATAAA